MSNKSVTYFSTFVFVLSIYACSKFEPGAPVQNSVMNIPFENLSPSQNTLFNSGAEEFDQNYTSETGLGPLYVSTSCASCHAEDNRGHLSLALVRFGQSDTTGNPFIGHGGSQIQNRALFGFTPELIPNGVVHSTFLAPIVAGVGLLENISDETILSMSDPFDSNGDGISGVPNWIKLPDWVNPSNESQSQGGKYIGRFGRKASVYNLFQQTTQAFNQDMGITSSFMPTNPGALITNIYPTPEITNEGLGATIFYLQVLQPPYRRNENDEQVLLGENLFDQIGCESCHRSSLTTSVSSIEGLNNKVIHPYSDLLLHDMGPGLDDGYTEGSALTSEWRTSPLWGIGLARDAQGGSLNLLHDGRAHSIHDAILFHGGEASQSVSNYDLLSTEEREALIKFLESL